MEFVKIKKERKKMRYPKFKISNFVTTQGFRFIKLIGYYSFRYSTRYRRFTLLIPKLKRG